MRPVLFDEQWRWTSLLPLTFTRPAADLRIGILTIREKWERFLGKKCDVITQDYLHEKFPRPKTKNVLYINSGCCPDAALAKSVSKLKNGESLVSGNTLIAYRGEATKQTEYAGKIIIISRPYDLFRYNGDALISDFDLITKNRLSLPLSRSVTVIGRKSRIFMETGARAEGCIINTIAGPVYIGKNAEIMEGSAVRGPFAIGEESQVKMSAKIYGPTTIGPHCKVGGEINNSVIFGYSNKAHDGFLGNSVIGEWCNLGADTNNSNLKNNYANVKLYNYATSSMEDTGLQFCGLVMGDHSKCGINTMFNTGTVVGVGCNIYGGDFPATFVPDFSWGGSRGLETYKAEKLYETAERVFARRGLSFSEKDRKILDAIRSKFRLP